MASFTKHILYSRLRSTLVLEGWCGGEWSVNSVLNMCIWDTRWICTESSWKYTSSVDKNRSIIFIIYFSHIFIVILSVSLLMILFHRWSMGTMQVRYFINTNLWYNFNVASTEDSGKGNGFTNFVEHRHRLWPYYQCLIILMKFYTYRYMVKLDSFTKLNFNLSIFYTFFFTAVTGQ